MDEQIKELGNDFANKDSRDKLMKLIRNFLKKKDSP